MGVVVRLSDFIKPGKGLRGSAPTPEPEPAYCCMRCDGYLFKLFPSGLVKCTHCGAEIRNVVVTDSTTKA